jgi:hypothetical protein
MKEGLRSRPFDPEAVLIVVNLDAINKAPQDLERFILSFGVVRP